MPERNIVFVVALDCTELRDEDKDPALAQKNVHLGNTFARIQSEHCTKYCGTLRHHGDIVPFLESVGTARENPKPEAAG